MKVSETVLAIIEVGCASTAAVWAVTLW